MGLRHRRGRQYNNSSNNNSNNDAVGLDDNASSNHFPPPAIGSPAATGPHDEISTARPRMRVAEQQVVNNNRPHGEDFVYPQQQQVHDDYAAVEAHEEVVDHQVQEEQAPGAAAGGGWGKKWVLAIVGCLLTLGATAALLSWGTISSVDIGAANDSAAVCYNDYPSVDEDYDDVGRPTPRCPSSNWKPCPTDAVCKGGFLQDCDNKHMTAAVVDDTKQKTCVLSTQSKRTIASIRKLLHDWTVADVCQPTGNPDTQARYPGDNENDSSDRPLFLYSKLAREIKMEFDWKLIELANTHGVDDELLFVWRDEKPGGNRTIGLHPSQRLELPGACLAKLASRQVQLFLFDCLIVLPAKAVWSILGIYWDHLWETPRETLFCTVVVPLMGWIIISWLRNRRMRQEERRTMRTDRINIRQQVFNLLSADPRQNHAHLHLRDAILSDPSLPYAAANAKRQNQLIRKVWPVVVQDIKRDNRVREEIMLVDGEPHLTWRWIATSVAGPVNGPL